MTVDRQYFLDMEAKIPHGKVRTRFAPSPTGYMHVGNEAWKVCPLCKAEQGYVDLHLPFEGVRK